jgi:lysophospholipase L1-like esterase
MKIIKFLLVFVLIIGLCISTWLFYPQYQIYKLKRQAVEVSTHPTGVSYLDYFRNSKAPSFNHLAIGDSIIRGVGAAQNEDLVNQFSSKLEQQINKEIHFQNEGINGITSSGLKELVLEGQFDEEIKKSDIITISVGGNDILQLASEQNFQNILKTFDQLQSTFSKNLSDISSRINGLNPNATIVFLELYNPFSPDNQVYSIADQLLPKWNVNIYEAAKPYSSSIVVETTKVINGESQQNLSPDGVHPNAMGYSAISEQIIYQFKNQYRKESA